MAQPTASYKTLENQTSVNLSLFEMLCEVASANDGLKYVFTESEELFAAVRD